MKTIYKYPLTPESAPVLRMPQGAEILTINVQAGTPMLWALVDPKAPFVLRTFEIYGTGEPIDAEPLGRYVGTFFVNMFVFHVFESVTR